jgi:hypothetical protein
MGSHKHGFTIPGWVNGQTQARVVWTGENIVFDPDRFEKVYSDPQELLQALGAIESYVNLELVSAKLEARGAE